MSEKQENWKEEMRKIVREELVENKKTPSPSSEPKHWTAEEHIDPNCPECQKEVEKIGKAYMKKTMTERKDKPAYCKDCKTPLGEDEDECPTCGGKDGEYY